MRTMTRRSMATLQRQPKIELPTRRSRLAESPVGIADVLTPVAVRVFSDCEMRWFYEHLLGVPDPPTASEALERAIRAALLTNFRYKLESKQNLHIEGVVGLFRRAWEKQQQAAVFSDEEHPLEMGATGEALVRIYMKQAAPRIRPAAVEQKTMRGVLASVRVQGEFDIRDEGGTIIAIRTAQHPPTRMDPMQRFELTTCRRLTYEASGKVRLDILITGNDPHCVSQPWEVTEDDIRFNDTLYPLAQQAMRRGYYIPNRSSVHCSRHHCPHWRRCEDEFGGTVEP